VLGVAHQLVEMDFGGSDEGASTATPLDHAFSFHACQCMASGHQADLV